jgi:hypothetical protein
MIIQLKRGAEWIEFLAKVKRARVVIVSEGSADVEIFKRVVDALNVQLKSAVAVDAGGASTLVKRALPAVVVLIASKVVRHAKAVAVLTDA